MPANMIFASIQSTHLFSESLGLFWVLVIAGIGALVVLIGVSMEVFWDKEEYETAKDLHRSEAIKHWGGRLVVAGLIWEVLFGTGLAIKDELDSRKTQAQIEANKPRELTLMQMRGIWGMLDSLTNKPPVRILRNGDAADAENLGNQIAQVLQTSGFQIRAFMDTANFGGLHGIFVGEYGETNNTSSEIVRALKWANLLAATNAGANVLPKELIIEIELK